MTHDHTTDMTPDWRRSHRCGEVTEVDSGRTVVVLGWVQSIRDHGGVLFLDVRDAGGIVQVVVSPEDPAFKVAETVRGEYVIGVRGRVELRPPGLENPQLPTGRIEIRASELVIFNSASMLPITVGDGEIDEALRLRYRYLDLRRSRLHNNLALRHRAADLVRGYLNGQGFMEIDTPFLTRSSPEGARDYLVPSRLAPGSVFALAQSPQLFKQLLMVAGYDRYFQIVRCFRDEDLRADRQPEFTQIDIEMSFVTADDVMALTEGMMADLWRSAIGVELSLPFPRMTWAEAMSRYGTDKPDLRCGLEIRDLGPAFSHGRIGVFARVLADGGSVYGITVPGGAGMSRRELDELQAVAVGAGARGLAHFAFGPDGLKSPLKKFLLPEDIDQLAKSALAAQGDLVVAVAGPWRSSVEALGVLRREVARRFSLIQDEFRFCWVVEFPLFEFDEAENRYEAVHHPFTAPLTSDLDLLESDPARVRAQAYDMVLNGTELGGGSIRIHRRDVQERAFRAMNLDEDRAQDKFGYLLQALQFGAPPHGGVALGFDRIVMMLARENSIREVIAFPKTTRGACLMTGAPSQAEPDQLAELGLSCSPVSDGTVDDETISRPDNPGAREKTS